jgi:hypothetical protein
MINTNKYYIIIILTSIKMKTIYLNFTYLKDIYKYIDGFKLRFYFIMNISIIKEIKIIII